MSIFCKHQQSDKRFGCLAFFNPFFNTDLVAVQAETAFNYGEIAAIRKRVFRPPRECPETQLRTGSSLKAPLNRENGGGLHLSVKP